MPKISKSQILALVRKIQKRERLSIAQTRVVQRPQLRDLRRDFGKRLQPLFADAGSNMNKIKKAHSAHQKEVRKLIEKQIAEADKNFSRSKSTFRPALDIRGRALEQINGLSLITTPIVLDTPFSIYIIPSGAWRDENITSYGSWVRLQHGDEEDGYYKTASARFFFSWQNESGYAAVINASADVLLRGYVEAFANGGFFTSGYSSVWVGIELRTYIGAINAQLAAANITSVTIDPPGELFGGGQDYRRDYLDRATTLSTGSFIVEDGQLVIFSVGMTWQYNIDDGHIYLDFDRGFNYGITCPALVVGLLSPPTIAPNLAFVTDSA
jgi:hypothetical protein